VRPEIVDLIKYRFERAHGALRQAEALLEINELDGAMNRMYYAMFYATLALLATKGLASSRHTGAIALFNREFVRSGQFPVETAKYLSEAFDQRLNGDYRDFYVPEKEKLDVLMEGARAFVAKAEDVVRAMK
jgi:uncharacterized protein (UPF0332 family)